MRIRWRGNSCAWNGLAARTGANIQSGLAGGHGGYGGTGMSGILRELIVIPREIMSGNFSRVPGSITLLAQRMGLLKYVIKETAVESVALAAAQSKVADTAEIVARIAARKAAASGAAAAAETTLTDATLRTALADLEAATAADARAVAARASAAALADEAAAATMAGEAATASIGPIGWLIAGLIALGAAAFLTVRHFRTLATEEKTWRI